MFSRTTTLLILITCLFVNLPLTTDAHKKDAKFQSQNRPLEISTIHSNRNDGKKAFNLTGRYKKGDAIVHLRGVTVRSAHRKLAANRKNQRPPKPSQPPIVASAAVNRFAPAIQDQNPAMIEESADPGYDYYYTQGEMSRSDGTVLINSIYQYQSATSQNVFTITLAGVTFSFNLATYEQTQPVSDAEIAQVEAWLNSDDGLLARQTGIALIEQGHQQPDNEALFVYYLAAMMIGEGSTTEAAIELSRQRHERRSHHASTASTEPRDVRGIERCLAVLPLSDRENWIKILLTTPAQCYGACGVGCRAIHTRFGVPIYAQPCLNHDNCVRGRSRAHPACWHHFAASVAVVVARYFWGY
jgi:hypothetical protein